jgi:hypothetical protein
MRMRMDGDEVSWRGRKGCYFFYIFDKFVYHT